MGVTGCYCPWVMIKSSTGGVSKTAAFGLIKEEGK